MVEERSPRRLAAILAADVVGYSRLVEQDEAGTLDALRSRRKEVLRPLVARHQGRIFKFTGDGVLVEFGSAVNAVQCAVDLQRDMAAANEKLPEERHIVLRVGVNLGDVIVEGTDLYGEGINIAARLEGIANPGGIFVSGTAFDHVRNKVDAEFDDLGAQTLKNIAEPVRVYRVAGARSMAASISKVAPGRPSIAVLPFDNMSGDAEQQYFSDGITEDIITELSRFRTFVVIARNSSFQFRDKASDVRRVARELGAQYVLEGSVRKAGTALRVTAQFIEGATGSHLWAERYDCSLEDVFRVQDELVHRIVGRLEGRLAASLAEKARTKSAPNLAAYDFVLQARAQLNNQNGAAAAEPLLARAMQLDPGYAQTYTWLAHTWMLKYFFDSRPEVLDQAVEYGRMAVKRDEDDGQCHMTLGNALVFQRQFEQAGAHLERALILNPSDALILGSYSHWLLRVGRIDEALAGLEEVVRRDPFPPAYIVETIAIAQMQAQRYAEAIKTIRGLREWQPWNYAYLAGCYAALGDLSQANAYAAETMKAMPTFSIRWQMLQEPFQNQENITRFEEMLRKAGFPG
jgi:TolB-like protein/tetratricopeptide (TPR) repeat protein